MSERIEHQVDTEGTPLSPDAVRWADVYFATLKDLAAERERAESAERLVGKARDERDAATNALDAWQRRADEAERGRDLLAVTLKRREQETFAARQERDAERERRERAETAARALVAAMGHHLGDYILDEGRDLGMLLGDEYEELRAALRAALAEAQP